MGISNYAQISPLAEYTSGTTLSISVDKVRPSVVKMLVAMWFESVVVSMVGFVSTILEPCNLRNKQSSSSL